MEPIGLLMQFIMPSNTNVGQCAIDITIEGICIEIDSQFFIKLFEPTSLIKFASCSLNLTYKECQTVCTLFINIIQKRLLNNEISPFINIIKINSKLFIVCGLMSRDDGQYKVVFHLATRAGGDLKNIFQTKQPTIQLLRPDIEEFLAEIQNWQRLIEEPKTYPNKLREITNLNILDL